MASLTGEKTHMQLKRRIKSSNYVDTTTEKSKQIHKTKSFLALYVENFFGNAWISAKIYSK